MPTCDICGGPRINGASLEKKHGEWRRVQTGTPHATRACRDCAKEALGLKH